MTDMNNTPEITDEQALQQVDLLELGVTTENTPENLIKLYTLANEALDHVRAAADAAKEAAKNENASDPKSLARKQVTDVEPSENLSIVMDNVSELIFTVLDADPSQAVPILTSLGSIVKYVTDVRDAEIVKATAAIKREKGIDPTTPDPDDDVEYHKNVFKACRGVLTKLIGVFAILGIPVPKEIPTKTNSLGDLVPDMRDLPKGRAAGTSNPNAGRGSKSRRVRYTWTPTNGEAMQLPEGTTLAEIAVTIISQGKYRVLNSELQEMFGKDKIDQFSETPWEIEFDTGTLSGYLPKQES